MRAHNKPARLNYNRVTSPRRDLIPPRCHTLRVRGCREGMFGWLTENRKRRREPRWKDFFSKIDFSDRCFAWSLRVLRGIFSVLRCLDFLQNVDFSHCRFFSRNFLRDSVLFAVNTRAKSIKFLFFFFPILINSIVARPTCSFFSFHQECKNVRVRGLAMFWIRRDSIKWNRFLLSEGLSPSPLHDHMLFLSPFLLGFSKFIGRYL